MRHLYQVHSDDSKLATILFPIGTIETYTTDVPSVFVVSEL